MLRHVRTCPSSAQNCPMVLILLRVKDKLLRIAREILRSIPSPILLFLWSHFLLLSLCSTPKWPFFFQTYLKNFWDFCIALHSAKTLFPEYHILLLILFVSFECELLTETLNNHPIKNWIPSFLHDLLYFLALHSFINFFVIWKNMHLIFLYIIYLTPQEYHIIKNYVLLNLQWYNQYPEEYDIQEAPNKHLLNEWINVSTFRKIVNNLNEPFIHSTIIYWVHTEFLNIQNIYC